jgi:hypothetical protein
MAPGMVFWIPEDIYLLDRPTKPSAAQPAPTNVLPFPLNLIGSRPPHGRRRPATVVALQTATQWQPPEAS